MEFRLQAEYFIFAAFRLKAELQTIACFFWLSHYQIS